MEKQKVSLRITNCQVYDPGKDYCFELQSLLKIYCESNPSHALDTVRLITAPKGQTTIEDHLKMFERFLKETVYENPNIEFNLMDHRVQP